MLFLYFNSEPLSPIMQIWRHPAYNIIPLVLANLLLLESKCQQQEGRLAGGRWLSDDRIEIFLKPLKNKYE